MKKSFFAKFKGFIGLLLLVAIIAGIYYWESYGREQLVYTDVVVLNQDVEANTVINADMLSYVKRDSGALIENSVTDPNIIVGLEAKHFIPKNSQLSERYFGDPDIVLDDGEVVFKIPSEWLRSYPQSIRRKDHVLIYPVPSEQFDNTLGTLPVETAIKTTVAFAKDSANKEVVDLLGARSTGNSYAEAREDGSAIVSSIEVIATTDMIRSLKDYRDQGMEFIIVYDNN